MCGVFESVALTRLCERYVTNGEWYAYCWTQLNDLSLCEMALLFINSIKEFLWSACETLLECFFFLLFTIMYERMLLFTLMYVYICYILVAPLCCHSSSLCI